MKISLCEIKHLAWGRDIQQYFCRNCGKKFGPPFDASKEADSYYYRGIYAETALHCSVDISIDVQRHFPTQEMEWNTWVRSSVG